MSSNNSTQTYNGAERKLSWMYSDPLENDSAIMVTWFVEIALWCAITACQWTNKQSPSVVRDLYTFKVFLLFFLWVLLEIIVICARLDYLLEGPYQFTPMLLDDEELVYISNHFYDADPQQKAQYGCDFNMTGARSPPMKTCQLLYYLGAEFVSQGYVRFSIVVGIMIFISLQGVCIVVKAYEISLENRGFWYNLLICIAFAAVECVLSFQQYMVLLPLTAVSVNPYCLNVQVPVSTKKAICEFKIACAAIPYGVPSFVGGAAVLWFGQSFKVETGDKNNDTGAGMIIYALVMVTGAYLLFNGVIYIVFWLFGGIVLGFWYEFGGLELDFEMSRTTLIFTAMKCTPFFLSLFENLIFPVNGVHDIGSAVKSASWADLVVGYLMRGGSAAVAPTP